MRTYLVAVHLLVEAGPQPRAAIDAALHNLLSEGMRQNAGPRSMLIDWAVAGDDLAASMLFIGGFCFWLDTNTIHNRLFIP